MATGTRADGETKVVATHSRILDAATSEFADYGLAGARIVRIAASAECNKQMIYHYFGDKLGLYDAVQRRIVSRARASIEHERSKSLPFMESHVFDGPEFGSRSEWARLQLWDGLTGVDGNTQLNSLRAENFELLRDWIRSDQEAGLVTTDLTANQVLALFLLTRLVPTAMPNIYPLMLAHDEFFEGQPSLLALVRKVVEPAS